MDDSLSLKRAERLETLAAILIAVVVVLAAVVAWRASQVDDAAGDADYDGLRSALKAEETRALNSVNAYEDFGMYLNYWRYSTLGELLTADLEAGASPADALLLEEQVKTADELSTATEGFFEVRFLNRDGTYNIDRQLGEMWADAIKENDLEYTSKFDQADRLRARTRQFLLVLLIFSLGLVFFSLVESFSGAGKTWMIGLGSLVSLAAVILWVTLELSKV